MAASPTSDDSAIVREEQIAKIHIFAGLRPEALALVAQLAVEETHSVGTVMFKHGDTGEKLYVIVEGRVRITREVQGMGEEALAILGPGDVFEDLLFVHKDLAYEVLWNVVRLLTRRLRETNDRFAMLSFASKF
jgi:CRP/FNR family transcriptional regulator, cyclic AMP receptor protein